MVNDLDMTLRDLMRAQDVTRWQIVRCGKAQSIAEHSWAVAVIAQKLWATRFKFPAGHVSKGMMASMADVANVALWHDAPEVFTGDINTPTKVFLKGSHPGLAASLSELEDTAGEMYRKATDVSNEVTDCVKLADYMEALYFLYEYGLGSYADEQFNGLYGRLRQYMAEVDGGAWADSVRQLMSELLGGKETTTFDRVEALIGKNS